MKAFILLVAIVAVFWFISTFSGAVSPCSSHGGEGTTRTTSFYGVTMTEKSCADGFIYERSHS